MQYTNYCGFPTLLFLKSNIIIIVLLCFISLFCFINNNKIEEILKAMRETTHCRQGQWFKDSRFSPEKAQAGEQDF